MLGLSPDNRYAFVTETVPYPQVGSVPELDARFEELFAAQFGYVIRTLMRLGVRPSDGEDVAQDVFFAVFHRLRDYDATRPARPWLFAFAFRAAANYRRLARHRRESPAQSEPGGASTQENDLEAAERRVLLQRALNDLDFEHRAAVVAVDLDEVAPKDAAKAMGIPLNTLYSRVRNARKKLRVALKSSPETEQRSA